MKRKKLTLKQFKESGWHVFVDWAIDRGLSPKDFFSLEKSEQLIFEWRYKCSKDQLIQSINEEMFKSYADFSSSMIGLSEQLKDVK